MDKSFVTMEKQICVVCGKQFDTGSLLLDTRLKDSFDMYTVTGFGMCDSCTELKDKGFIALIEATNNPTDSLSQQEANRTGRIAHLKLEAFKEIFNVPAPKGGICFVQEGVIAKLEAMNEG